MKPVSEAQYRAATEGGVPEPEFIGDGVWSVPMQMPGEFLAYSLAVVHVGARGGATVIDLGWGLDAALDRLDAFLGSIGRSVGDVASIVVTHAHPDHIGLADALREASGAPLLLHRREQDSIDARSRPDAAELAARMRGWGLSADLISNLEGRLAAVSAEARAPRPADVLLEDGDRLPVDGEDWRVLLTPGHTPGHICIVDESRRLLFTGDHVLPTVHPGLGLGSDFDENPLVAYLRSLRRLKPFDEFEVVPGHGYRFRGLGDRRRSSADHVLRRAREVAAVIAAEPDASTWDVASRLTWTGGWDQLADSMMLYSALMQTDMYRDFVSAGGLDSPHATVD